VSAQKKEQMKEISDDNKNTDNRAIRIRENCKTPLNVYRTCYERAVDPNSDVPDDEFQLRNPFSQPYIGHDEWMVSDTMHFELTQNAANTIDGELDCKDILALEELSLKYLKDNIGNEDTFSPVCTLISESAIKQEIVDDGSGRLIQTIALKIDITFAFNRKFSQSKQLSLRHGLRHLMDHRHLAGSNRGGFGMCCTSHAVNSKGARGSARCGGGSGKCRRPPKKKTPRSLFESDTLPDLYKQEFDRVVGSYTVLKPVETRGILDAKSTEDVAVCAVNRYIEDALNVPSMTCQKYRDYQCISNEDIVIDPLLACDSGIDEVTTTTSTNIADCSAVSCPSGQSCDPFDG
jgi:hypothetical protein